MQTYIKSVQETLLQTDNFVIPCFQRAYSWTKGQVEALIKDIESLMRSGSQDPLFLGSIIYLSTDQQLQLIDGQQRITTLFLLCKAFSEKFKVISDMTLRPSLELLTLQERLECIILRQGKAALETQVYAQTDPYAQSFATIMTSPQDATSSQDAQNTYQKNYAFCQQWVDEYWCTHENQDVYQLVTVLLERSVLVNLKLDNLDVAIKIFETLNNRGLKLSDMDIFKAVIYANCQTAEDRLDFLRGWMQLEKYASQVYSLKELFQDLQRIKQAQNHAQGDVHHGNFHNNGHFTCSLRDFWLGDNYRYLTEQHYQTLLDELRMVLDFKLLPYYSDPEFKQKQLLPNSYIQKETWYQDIEILKACYVLLFLNPRYPRSNQHYGKNMHQEVAFLLLSYWFNHHQKPQFAQNFKLFVRRLIVEFALYLCVTEKEAPNIKDLLVNIFKEELPTPNIYDATSYGYRIDNQQFKDRLCSDFSYTLQAVCLMVLVLNHPQQTELPNFFAKPILREIVYFNLHPEVNQDNELGTYKFQIGNRSFVYYQNKAPKARQSDYNQAQVFLCSNITTEQASLKTRVAFEINKDIFPQGQAWSGDFLQKISERNQQVSTKISEILSQWLADYEQAQMQQQLQQQVQLSSKTPS